MTRNGWTLQSIPMTTHTSMMDASILARAKTQEQQQFSKQHSLASS